MKQNLKLMQPIVGKTSITFKEAFWVWVRIAIYSFGGPAGQMAVMYKILVEEKNWISEERFLHALNFTMFLPGPEAQQLTIYMGWLLHGTLGGLVAGSLFVLPGFISILALSMLYAGFQGMSLVQALFFGLKPAVMAVVVEAVLRIGKRALKSKIMIIIAVLAFMGIFFFHVPFPIIVLIAGIIGLVGGKYWVSSFDILRPSKITRENDTENPLPILSDLATPQTKPSTIKSIRILIIGLLLWFIPLIAMVIMNGGDDIFVKIGLFFSKTAVVTFGGAYSVLAYIAQQAVDVYGWLQPGQMLDGLGMAETTPGPLIQVVQFVGFMAAYQNSGVLSPLIAGIYASLVTTWVTFIPCFIWIFVGAPYIEYLRGNKSLSSSLSTITAAVVGVILNLAVWFSLQTIFTELKELTLGPIFLSIPVWSSIDWASLTIAIGAFIALFKYKTGMIATLGGSALMGLLYYLLFLV